MLRFERCELGEVQWVVRIPLLIPRRAGRPSDLLAGAGKRQGTKTERHFDGPALNLLTLPPPPAYALVLCHSTRASSPRSPPRFICQ